MALVVAGIVLVIGTDQSSGRGCGQVPADLREYIKHKTNQQFEKMREMMKEEGFHPTSSAATQPAGPATRPAAGKRDEDL